MVDDGAVHPLTQDARETALVDVVDDGARLLSGLLGLPGPAGIGRAAHGVGHGQDAGAVRVVEQVEGEGPPLGVPGGAADAVPARRGYYSRSNRTTKLRHIPMQTVYL